MASSKIIKQRVSIQREIAITYSIPGSSTFNTNLKTAIDNDMPSGYEFGGLAGFATNDINAVVNNLGYYDSAYSLQLWNRASSAIAEKNMRLFYMAQPK